MSTIKWFINYEVNLVNIYIYIYIFIRLHDILVVGYYHHFHYHYHTYNYHHQYYPNYYHHYCHYYHHPVTTHRHKDKQHNFCFIENSMHNSTSDESYYPDYSILQDLANVFKSKNLLKEFKVIRSIVYVHV